METQWKQKKSMWEERGRQKHAVKWGSLETENIWPRYASYFAFPRLGALVLKEIFGFWQASQPKEASKQGPCLGWIQNSGVAGQVIQPFPSLGPSYTKKIVRMPDSHSRAGAFSSFTPLPSFSACWRQPPRPHDSAAKQHTCWLRSPSGPAPSPARLPKIQYTTVLPPGHAVMILQ